MGTKPAKQDLLPGTLDMLILKTLTRGVMHGYGIARRIEQMSEDALQYAPDKEAAMVEAARILRPGGRLVCSTYELNRERATDMPILGLDPVEDYRPALAKAGFKVDSYEEVPGWPEPMTTTYSTILKAGEDLTREMGEAAVAALFLEMTMTVQKQPYQRRVLFAATRE